MDLYTKQYLCYLAILGIIFIVSEFEYVKSNNLRGNLFGIAALSLIGIVMTIMFLVQNLTK